MYYTKGPHFWASQIWVSLQAQLTTHSSKFSIVSSLISLLCNLRDQLTFEKHCLSCMRSSPLQDPRGCMWQCRWTGRIYVKRDPYLWKETHVHEKKPTKETCTYHTRPTHVKRDPHMSKETQTNEKIPLKETWIHQKRPVHIKWHPNVWRKTHTYGKSPTLLNVAVSADR